MGVASTDKTDDALSRLRIRRDESPRRRSVFGRLLRGVVWLAVVGALGAGGWWLGRSRGWIPRISAVDVLPTALQSRPEVRTERVVIEQGRSADALVVATGYLESRRQAKIGARAPGRIEVVNVEEGSRVAEDEVLAVLEHADLDASLAATRATRNRARAELAEQDVLIEQKQRALRRAEELQPSGSITEAEFDTAKFEYDSAVARKASLQAAIELAEARVREAEQLKENMFIRAPFDGTVISKDAEVGESIMPGGMGEASGRGSVVTIADLEHLEVDCDVKEDYISRVESQQSVEVAVDAVPGRRYQGRVRKIIPMGDRARATVKVKVEILDADERLFPEMSATVYFLSDASSQADESTEPRLFVPADSVVRNDAIEHVWVVDDDERIRLVPITAGTTRDGRTEILDGLDGSETVVVAPADSLTAGTRIRRSD